MADNIKQFLDKSGVSTLWGQVASNLAAEKARAEAAEAAALKAAQDAQKSADDLGAYVGTIPSTYTESNIVAFIQKRAQEVLAAAQGGSSETAASVKAALDAYIAENDADVAKNAGDIATIVADYLKAADKTELSGLISANAGEIARIDAALKAAVDDEDGAGLDSIKDLATWIETHGTEAAGYATAIQALEGLVGDETVAAQIEAAIAAEALSQYAKTADIQGTLDKVDTQGTVTAAISAAIDALKIGDYAKAADLTTLAAKVTALQNAGYQNADQVSAIVSNAITALKAENLWDAQGAASAAESRAKSYAETKASEAEANAKAYADTQFGKIQALSTNDILAAISEANAKA
jgi:hypothetical protein